MKTNDDCPTCKQGLDEEHKKKHIEEKQDKVTEIKTAVSTLEEQVQELNENPTNRSEIQDDINTFKKKLVTPN